MSDWNPAMARLKHDYLRLKRDPVPYITAEPMPDNILKWHYVVKGPEDTPYHGGYYHGMLLFPREFPFKPPSIYMFTPNGRFKTYTRLCLSISDFHPETWNPAWSAATILTGLLSFMLEKTPTEGSIVSCNNQKMLLARKSLQFNLTNTTFRELFPEMVAEICLKLNIESINGVTSQNRGVVAAAAARAIAAGESQSGGINVDKTDAQSNKKDHRTWKSLCSNFMLIIIVAIFALIVNYMIRNLSRN